MKTRKTLMVLLMAVVVVICAFAPSLFFSVQDHTMYTQVYERQDVKAQIDPAANDIYLVKAIQDLYNMEKYMTVDMEYVLKEYPEILNGLFEAILSPEMAEKVDVDHPSMAVTQLEGPWSQTNTWTPFFSIWGFDQQDEYMELSFGIEEKTQKILYIRAAMDDYGVQFPNKNGIVESYIAYLGLDILGDWEKNEMGALSKRAQLQITCLVKQGTLLLSIAPTDSLSSYIEESSGKYGMN